MKHLFIVNPKAGGKDATEDVRARVQAAFRTRNEPYEIYVTRGPRDATRKIRLDASNGEELRVYACGGDGTFNECVCGAALEGNVSVCPFPTGTGNDFCRMFCTDADLFRDLNALLDGTVHEIDLIACNGTYSVNICSVGIDARIGTEVHKYSSLPVIGGAGGYVVSTLVNVFKGISRPMRVSAKGYVSEGPHALVCACNGRFYGGGFNPSQDARPDDGELDFFIVPDVKLFTLACYIGRYAKGKADRYPNIITHLKGDSLHIDFEEENVINVDGEAMYAKSVDMKLVPRALRLIVPKGMRFFEDKNR